MPFLNQLSPYGSVEKASSPVASPSPPPEHFRGYAASAKFSPFHLSTNLSPFPLIALGNGGFGLLQLLSYLLV